MNFKGSGKKLTDIDLPRIGADIGVGEDEIHAILDVETRGGGWDSQGRLKMLFEPHVFYRELGPGKSRDRAVKEGLAYRKWGAEEYPRDSYPRLEAAMKININAALRSASWGLGQIMGFNCMMVEYRTAKAMVEAFLKGEAEQLQAVVDFIVAAGLDDELRAHDWRGVARGYNGAGYAKHGYHIKLEKAFRRWQGIRDTPFTIDRTPDVPEAPKEIQPAPTPPKPVAPAPAPQPSGLMAAIMAIIAALFGRKAK